MKRFPTLQFIATPCLMLMLFTRAEASYVSTVLANSPVAYYRMQEPSVTHAVTTAVDSSGNGKDGLYLFASGGPGSISSIPGANGELSPGKQFNVVSNSGAEILLPVLTGAASSAFSIEFLIKPVADTFTSSDYRAIYTTNGSYETEDIHLNLAANTGFLEFAISGNGAAPQVNLPAVAPVGQWTHVVVTYGGGLAKFYANGTLLNPGGTSTGGSTAGGLNQTSWIGAWNGSSRFFSGGLDEFAIYNSVLSDSQVAAHFAAIPEPSAGVLMACGLFGAVIMRRRK